MEPVLVDGEWLAAVCPEGFQLVPHAELEALMGTKYSCMWGMRDTARHMLVSISWKDSNRLLTRMVGEKSLANRVDEAFARRYRKGGYHCDDHFECEVAGASSQAQGFRFSYTIEGVAQEGEVLVFKRAERCYTLYYYTRSEVAAENRPIFQEIIGSLVIR